MSVSPLLKRVLEVTSRPPIPAITLALKVFTHPPLLFHARFSLHVQFTALANYCVRLWVKMEISVCVLMSAQTPAVETAQEATALLGCRGDVEEVSAQWTLQELVYTGTTSLNDEKDKERNYVK